MDVFDENDSAARTKARNKSKSKRKNDWLVSLSTAQLVLACIGVALLLVVSKISPYTFTALKSEFETIMLTDMSVREVVGRIQSVFAPEIPSNFDDVTEPESESIASGGDDTEVYEASESVCFAPFDTTVSMAVPVEGRVTSRFGYRNHPITGEFGIHNGIDIATDEGEFISAAFNGRVEDVGYNSVRGNYIVLSHGSNTKTMYLHCQQIIAPIGAIVRQGEIIATVGNTGWSTGPHLHFSIVIGGKYCNPEWLLNDL